MSRLSVRDVTVRFDDVTVLSGVALDVRAGEVVALLGPSGSGKSTLLRVIAGIVAPDSGSVHIDDVDVTAVPTHRRAVGMVFQDDLLFPHRSTLDNVAFGLKMAGVGTAERRARAAEWLQRVGLAGFGERRVTELSGGEAKRVALARTLAAEPRIVLLDEPLTGLDRELHDRLLDELGRILRSTGSTGLLVTHDREEAAAIADRVVELASLQPPRVETISAADTHDLRRRLLRADTPSTAVEFDGDHEATTLHLGVRIGDELVAISTWLERPFPGRPDEPAVQLRGMATDPGHRGSGYASRLLEAGVERASARGAQLVWARARAAVLDFYVARHFDVEGDEFVDEATGLPHRLVVRRLV